MAEAALHTFKGCNDSEEEGELLSVRSFPVEKRKTPNKTSSSKTSTATSATASKKGKQTMKSGAKLSDLQSLEEKLSTRMDGKFSSLESKMELLLSAMAPKDISDSTDIRTSGLVDNRTQGASRPQHTELGTGTLGARRPLVSIENSLNRDYGLVNDEDMVSLQPREDERRVLVSSQGSESHSNEMDTLTATRFDKYVSSQEECNSASALEGPLNNNVLRQMFGDDAELKQDGHNVGLSLDQTQIQLLESSWRCPLPERLSAYKESYKQTFPLNDSALEILQVPSLDEMSERLLVKKHGRRAAFGSTQALFSQPFKSMERIAFQGQVAARMGLITLCYAQQALGSLLQNLQAKDPNMDEAVQNVRDIFAISTKSMDQMARTGAFHHLLRRKATIADTGLHEYKDLQKAAITSPLSGDGIFGKQFENKLKERQEKDKQLTELMPELNKRYVIPKRKAPAVADNYGKRPRFSSQPDSSFRQYKSDKPAGNRGFKRPTSTYNRPAEKTSMVSSFRVPGKNKN